MVFLGNAGWSVPSLLALAEDRSLEVVLVVTNPPKPAGRGAKLTPTPVAEAARSRAFDLVEVDGVRRGAGRAALEAARPDALAVVAYGAILPPDVLAIPAKGAINLHFSLLPRWRGAAPVHHALLEGDKTTGVTTMLMEEGLDTGPILEQLEESIRKDDDTGTLGERLATIGARLLARTLRTLDGIEPRPQDQGLVTTAPKLTAEDRSVNWTAAAVSIERRIRALAPEPGARTTFRGEPLGLLKAEVTRGEGDPGAILGVDDTGVIVGAREGAIRLLSVAPAGRRHLGALDWANGARFGPRERLG